MRSEIDSSTCIAMTASAILSDLWMVHKSGFSIRASELNNEWQISDISWWWEYLCDRNLYCTCVSYSDSAYFPGFSPLLYKRVIIHVSQQTYPQPLRQYLKCWNPLEPAPWTKICLLYISCLSNYDSSLITIVTRSPRMQHGWGPATCIFLVETQRNTK